MKKEDLQFRKATAADVDASAKILRQAARQMMEEGKRQWTETYPTDVHVKADIERGVGYVLVSEGNVIGYCAVVFDGEPAYSSLSGCWLTEKPYVVVHRIALNRDFKGKGLGEFLMKLIEKLAIDRGMESFRIDTNYDNFSMLGLLDKLGFSYCGEVTYESGSRKAFEKILLRP